MWLLATEQRNARLAPAAAAAACARVAGRREEESQPWQCSSPTDDLNSAPRCISHLLRVECGAHHAHHPLLALTGARRLREAPSNELLIAVSPRCHSKARGGPGAAVDQRLSEARNGVSPLAHRPPLFCLPTCRTPHSPAGSTGKHSPGMASPRPATDDALVRPVTARTWQALGPGAAADDSPRRMSVYNNDLYGSAGADAAAARPASPLYQPASARPTTPTPRSAERLQQQRIATPSRLQTERAPSPSLQLREAAGAGGSPSATGAPAPAGQQGGATPTRQQQQQPEQRPVTAPAPGLSPLRTSTFSLGAAAVPMATAAAAAATGSHRPCTPGGSSIAADSPRVRQRVLSNFAGAVPAGGSPAGGGGSAVGASNFGQGSGTAAGGRPATPSFRPVAAARPATALAGPPPAAAGSNGAAGLLPSDHFRIKAVLPAAQDPAAAAEAAVPPGLAAYPRPPQTAPQLGPAPGAGGGAAAAPEPGSLASFGITAGAFVAAAPKDGRAAGGAGGAVAARAQTRAAMLELTGFASKAELRWEGSWTLARDCWGSGHATSHGCPLLPFSHP